MTISVVIDTREQIPWAFDPSQVEVSISTLATGDYALAGDGGFAIERKTLDDFLGTISTRWQRFQRELNRAKEKMTFLPILVEGSLSDCCFREGWEDAVEWSLAEDGETKETPIIIPPSHRHYNLYPGFVMRRVAEIAMQGGAVMWCENAEYACAVATVMLRERHKLLEGGAK